MDLTNKTIKILARNEILKENDIVRLIVQTNDEGGFDTTYKSEDYRPLDWHFAKDEMSGWIGKKISDYSYNVWYEYARIIE